MSEWKEYKISELGKVITGKTPSSKNPEEWGTEIAFVTPTDFDSYNKSIEGSIRCLSERGARVFNSKLLPPNSVIVTCIGSQMGKVALNKIPCVTNQQINSIILNENFNSDFIFYVISSMQDYLRNLATGGSTMPIVNKSDFENIKIIAPDLPTQTAIAEILSSLDDKIELNNKINQDLENLAQTLFKQWFIDFEFPNENGEPYKSSGGEMVDSELGEIPKGWELGTFGDVIKKESLRVKKSESIVYKVYSAVKTSELVLSDEYFTKKVYSKSINNYFIVKNNWFAYNPSRINIGSIGLNKTGIGAVSPVYIVFSTKKYFHFFIEYILQLENTKNAIIQRCSGTVRQSLNFEGLSSIPLKIPNSELVRMFNDFVENNSEHIKMISNETIELTTLRDTLLPRLISGELEVSQIQTTS